MSALQLAGQSANAFLTWRKVQQEFPVTMMIVFIALLHGLPVFVIGAWTNSRAALILAALVAAAAGAASGVAVNILADVIAIACGFGMGIALIERRARRARASRKAEIERRHRDAMRRAKEERERKERERMEQERRAQAEREWAARQAEAQRRARGESRQPRTEATRSHYDNLQVTRHASEALIRAAYRALVHTKHPDKFKGPPEEAVRITKILNEAYAVLTDAERRRAHDAWLDSQARQSRSAFDRQAGFGHAQAGDQAARSHYDHLHVTRFATAAVIRAAYKTLTGRKHHDKSHGARDEAARDSKAVQEAFAVLSDPVRRMTYDALLDGRVDDEPSAQTVRQPEEVRFRAAQWVESERRRSPPGQDWTAEPMDPAWREASQAARAYRTTAERQRTEPTRTRSRGARLRVLSGVAAAVVMAVAVILFFGRTQTPVSPPLLVEQLPTVTLATSEPSTVVSTSTTSGKQAGATDIGGQDRKLPVVRPNSPGTPRLRKAPVEAPPRVASMNARVMESPRPEPARMPPPAPGLMPENPQAQDCEFSRFSSARTSCPGGSARQLRSYYVELLQRKKETGQFRGYWEARSEEIRSLSSRCSSEDCVRGVMYRAIEEIRQEPAMLESPG